VTLILEKGGKPEQIQRTGKAIITDHQYAFDLFSTKLAFIVACLYTNFDSISVGSAVPVAGYHLNAMK